MATGLRAALRVSGPRRGRRIAGRVVLFVAVALTAMTVLSLVAAMRDDHAISARLGRADADVLSVGYQRTVVSFTTPDGAVHVPDVGVIWPRRLSEGDRVRIEYDTRKPDLVRVAGRNWRLGLLPVGTSIVFLWMVAGPLAYWLLRRPDADRWVRRAENRSARTPTGCEGVTPPPEHLVGDARSGDQQSIER